MKKLIILVFAIISVITILIGAYFFIQNKLVNNSISDLNQNIVENIIKPFDSLNLSENEIAVLKLLVIEAKKRLDANVTYDPTYFKISYPNGDVPSNKGVCTDVVIRSYRGAGIDLQKLVHEDMSKNFNLYPNLWGLNKPDTNIDHRRVPNLITFFNRFAQVLPITNNPKDYYPGDIITWVFANGKTHTGILVDKRSTITGNPLIVHNVGAGPQLSDVLFEWQITGHFRYIPK